MNEQLSEDELVQDLREALKSGKGNYGHRLLCGKAADEIMRLREALKIIAEGTICPELFPKLDMERDGWELTAKTAAVSAIAALEPRA